MASVAQCEQAFAALAERMAAVDPEERKRNTLDRTLTCTLPDLQVIFAGKLQDGLLTDIRQVEDGEAQVRLRLSSDDLVRMVDGELNLASAWSTGRVKIDAGILDIIKLRSVF